MQYVDLAFNVKPFAYPDGFPLTTVWLDAACIAFMGGVLAKVFLRDLHRHPAYPLKDPRLIEAMGITHVSAAEMAALETSTAIRPHSSGPSGKGGAL
jgi:hypothetical protein